jgi:wyosine [tRNA(Phe)-imidazoG37] synthetase (radical SAM superfamily)
MVVGELHEWFDTDGKADYITLSGSGEPTLHSRFGEVLEFIRGNSAIPAVLLTNGTMLHLPEVRDAASQASIVKVSLSAWDQSSYRWVNRPYLQLRFDDLIEGQRAFRAQFKGQLWLEVFVVDGLNSIPSDARRIADLAKEFSPDRIQLNTAIRPPSEDFAGAVPKERMEALAHLFHPAAEIIGEFSPTHPSQLEANQDRIFSMLQRRPCTAQQIAEIFGMHLNEISKYLGKLMRAHQIRAKRKNTDVYYAAVTRDEGNAADGRFPTASARFSSDDSQRIINLEDRHFSRRTES